jgi:hypothetical protein
MLSIPYVLKHFQYNEHRSDKKKKGSYMVISPYMEAKNISIKNLSLKNLGIWLAMLFVGKASAI